jgi:DNA polymerase-3 subunit gamma/tau
LLSLQSIKQSLSNVAKELGVTVDDDALFWIAKESTGSMRDAYTLFDQITAFSEGVVTLKKIQDKLGMAGPEKLAAIISYAYNQQGAQAIEHIQHLLASGVSVEQAIKDFAELFRTLLLARRGVDNESILQMQMDRIPQDVQSAFNEDQLEAALELFLQLYRDIRFSLNPRFELELAVSRLSSLPYLVSNNVLLKRLTELQNNLLAGKETATIASRPITSVATPSPILTNDSPKLTDVVVNTPLDPPIVHQEVSVITNPTTERKEPAKPAKRVTKDILPAITQQLAIERNQLGIIISQVVDVVEKEDQVVLVFSSRFSMQTAKLNEEKIRSLIEHETGYDGKIDFGIIEVKQTEGQTRKNMDEVIDLVKTTFRGEIV